MGPALRTRSATAILILFLVATGCASSQSKRIDSSIPDQSYREIEEEMTGKQATIFMVNGDTYDGVIVGINADTTAWRIVPDAPPSSVPTATILQLHVLSGNKTGKGAVTGLAIGALGGFIAGAAAVNDDDYYDEAAIGGIGAAAFGLLGAGIGAIIGSQTASMTIYEINPGLARPPPPEQDQEPQDDKFEPF